VPTASPERLNLPPMTGPQVEILEATERVILVEGSPRSAKSWGVAFKIWLLVWQHPGIQIFYCRYKDEDLNGQLRDLWLKVCAFFPDYLQPAWSASEGAWDFKNGSRVYMRSLKVSTEALIHSKYKGLTLAVVVVEEASETLERNFKGLKERLSQSRTPEGTPYPYPLQIILVTNCVDDDHWIAKACPTHNGDGYRYIRADLHSNAHNLGPVVIAGYEADYPEGHPERPTVIEGRRGVTLRGTPVYGRQYKREWHVAKERIPFDPLYPLLEGWDFGEEKPAVVWWQYIRHQAAIRLLWAVKGSEMFLETFAPKVLALRQQMFPLAHDVQSWCDPTGATGNGGMRNTPVELLTQLGVNVQYTDNANSAPIRYSAIQVVGGYMLRKAVDGSPGFLMSPHCTEFSWHGETLVENHSSKILQTAFAAGYIWDDKAPPEANPNIRKPKKGTRYDDLMNAFEYPVIGEHIPIAQSTRELMMATAQYQREPDRQQLKQQMEESRALRELQRDSDKADRPFSKYASRRGRL
jgi:hypothetical protein